MSTTGIPDPAQMYPDLVQIYPDPRAGRSQELFGRVREIPDQVQMYPDPRAGRSRTMSRSSPASLMESFGHEDKTDLPFRPYLKSEIHKNDCG